MRTFLRRKISLLFMALGLLVAIPAVALAADLNTDAVLSTNALTPTWVGVGSPDANKFDIKVWANGNLPSAQTGAARVVNKYDMDTSGTITADSASTTDLDFVQGNNYTPGNSYCPANTTANQGTGPQGCVTNPYVVNATLNVATGTPDSTTGLLTVSTVGSPGLTADSTPDTGNVKVDAKKPTITLNTPAVGASYNVGDNVIVDYTCSDSGSGIKDTGGCVGTLDNGATLVTSTPGSYSFTVDAVDKVGNTESVTHNYTVVSPTSYTFNGFFQPVDNKIRNDAKGGSTIPLKFEVFKNGVEVTDPSEISSFVQREDCLAGSGDAIEEYASGNTGLRYDTTGGYFIFNWKTLKGAGCYGVTVSAGSASLSADFGLK
jgi:hypothetical protein